MKKIHSDLWEIDFARNASCVTGAGESRLGPGGAVHVSESGSVLFNGGVDITETRISDGFGGDGGAMPRFGTISVSGFR